MTVHAGALVAQSPLAVAAKRFGAACRAMEGRPGPVASEENPMELDLGDGNTFADNMGCGVVVIDQVDRDTQAHQRVVLTKEDLEKLLTWIG